MDLTDIYKKYIPTILDEKCTLFDNKDGITVIRYYPSHYKMEDFRAFLKIYINTEGIVQFSSNVTKYKGIPSGGYFLVTEVEHPHRDLFNFYESSKKEIVFDKEKRLFNYHGYEVDINDLFKQLYLNHIQYEPNIIVRIFKTWSGLSLLYILYFFCDQIFNRNEYYEKIYKENKPKSDISLNTKKPDKKNTSEVEHIPQVKEPEPLFHYFYIYKTILVFLTLIILTAIIYALCNHYISYEYPFLDISFIPTILMGLMLMYAAEKISHGFRQLGNKYSNYLVSLLDNRREELRYYK